MDYISTDLPTGAIFLLEHRQTDRQAHTFRYMQ